MGVPPDDTAVKPDSSQKKSYAGVGLPPVVAIVGSIAIIIALGYAIYSSILPKIPYPKLPGLPKSPASPSPPAESSIALKHFGSIEELRSFIKESSEALNLGGAGITRGALQDISRQAETAGPDAALAPLGKSMPQAGGGGAEEYSITNIQVAGVDEADIVKNDDKYIYLVSNGKIVILNAYPPEQAKFLSEIEVGGTPEEIFVNKDRLIVFGQEQEKFIPQFREQVYPPQDYPAPATFVKVFDISDRTDPQEVRSMSTEGNYYDSRMVGDYVYIVINHPRLTVDDLRLPVLKDDKRVQEIQPSDIAYFPVAYYQPRLTTIMAVNVQDERKPLNKQIYLMDSTDNMYVSPGNIFIVYELRQPPYEFERDMVKKVIIPILPTGIGQQVQTIEGSSKDSQEKWEEISQILENWNASLSEDQQATYGQRAHQLMFDWSRQLAKEYEKTVIHRIRINNGSIRYQAQGEVPGRVLNQFSMDEYQNLFRIATTTEGYSWGGREPNGSANHVYVLDSDLKVIGRLEDLARGERIYSARFMGKRAYLVTFRKIDPLFVLDLQDPNNPKVLGKLKIPGYSDYLHPYDENHLIGFGKEAVAAEEGNFAWFQGLKLALFDVSDPERPKEIAKHEIGDRGTDSEILQDHKALLFSRSKNLLVIPVLVAEIDETKYPGGVNQGAYGDPVWQGVYVFDISSRGISPRGQVTHFEKGIKDQRGFYIGSPASVRRSLYMNDTLYTISERMVKMNDLVSLDEAGRLYLTGYTAPPELSPSETAPVPPSVLPR